MTSHGIPSAPPPLEARHFAFSHAYFPRWAFDEVVEQGKWVFGRVGDGYVALYSDQPYEWVTYGPDADQEMIAPGYKNVWICQLGRASLDGSFHDFIASVSGADLKVEGLQVQFNSPGNGMLKFDWTGPLKLDDTEIALSGYARFDNPYGSLGFTVVRGKCGGIFLVEPKKYPHTTFLSRRFPKTHPYTQVAVNNPVYNIAFDGLGLYLDFERPLRSVKDGQ